MRVALVHDWLTGMRGGERVLEVLCRLLPEAPIFTLLHVPGSVSRIIEDRAIHTSPLQRIPGIARRYRALLPLFPWAVSRLDVRAFDLVVSVSSCVAKSVRVAEGARHICYINAPMRYAWDLRDDYFASDGLGRAKAALAGPVLDALRQWDRRTADRVHRYLTNAKNIAGKVERFYGRSAEVIPPPVRWDRFRLAPESERSDAYLVLSALVPYKCVDLAIEAFRGYGRVLEIAGDGPERARLQKSAPDNVRFLSRISDEEAAHRLARCRALIFPGEEDFGIVPLEAQAAGRPVIALGRGGALETIRPLDGEEPSTGLFFDEATPDALRAALARFEAREGAFDPRACRANALRFDEPVFEAALRRVLEEEGVRF
ncbi:MAG: glycosyltransferase [Planctomycetota bacterium]